MLRYQNVFIELSDGSKGVFTGPVLLEQPEEGKKMPSVQNIQFTEPVEPNEEEELELESLLKDLEETIAKAGIGDLEVEEDVSTSSN